MLLYMCYVTRDECFLTAKSHEFVVENIILKNDHIKLHMHDSNQNMTHAQIMILFIGS